VRARRPPLPPALRGRFLAVAGRAEGLEVGRVERPLEVHGQRDDVVDLGAELRAPGQRARAAEGLVAQHPRTHRLPAGRRVDPSYGGVAAGAVVLPVRVAAASQDPSKRARLRRHDASGHARWDERRGHSTRKGTPRRVRSEGLLAHRALLHARRTAQAVGLSRLRRDSRLPDPFHPICDDCPSRIIRLYD
jgi:hypothetical protein